MLNFRLSYRIFRKYRFLDYWDKPFTQASLELILSLATIFLLAIFALKPTLSTIASLYREINLKKEVEKKLEKKVIDLTQAQANYARIVQFLPVIDKSLPTEPKFTRLEQEIEYLTWADNVVLIEAYFEKFDLVGTTSTVTGKGSASRQPSLLRFKFTLGGSYKDLKKFFNDFENLDRIILLNQINLITQTKVAGAELQAEISADASFLPPIK